MKRRRKRKINPAPENLGVRDMEEAWQFMQVILSGRKLKRNTCHIKQKEIVVCALRSGNKILKRMRYVVKFSRVGPWVLGCN